MPAPFTTNPAKNAVRLKWDTPLLQYLHDTYGFKYRYMGLPGVDLIDVRLWQHMIEEVIAFEPPDQSPSRRDAIQKLRTNMRKFGISGNAYYGSLEEVVILGVDNDGQKYSQNNLVTLYNLDFCDEIASRIETKERGERIWRFEAIRQILRDQEACYHKDRANKYFILMITFRNQIASNKIRSLLQNAQLLAEVDAFCQVGNSHVPLPMENQALIGTHAWSLKAFLYNLLCGNFTNPHISALFFPLVLYLGTPVKVTHPVKTILPSPMLHLVVLCKFADVEAASHITHPKGFIRSSSIEVSDGGDLDWKLLAGEENSIGFAPGSVPWLEEYGQLLLEGLGTRQ